MPSRSISALIVAFWLAVTSFVFYREVIPRYFGDHPPVVLIELSDEATQAVPARWIIYRGDEKLGSVTTQLSYRSRDNLFRFTSTYRDVRLNIHQVGIHIPELEVVTDMTRDGDLRAQSLHGKMKAGISAGPIKIFDSEASATVNATVVEGQLVGTCTVRSPLGDFDQDLEPVPVAKGQLLNPMLPVYRLRGVRPGLRWEVREVNPLGDALTALGQGFLKKHSGSQLANLNLRKRVANSLIASVRDKPETLPNPPGPLPLRWYTTRDPVECWVIDYYSDQAQGKTWVRVTDGKVMRQEASWQGERLVLTRDN